MIKKNLTHSVGGKGLLTTVEEKLECSKERKEKKKSNFSSETFLEKVLYSLRQAPLLSSRPKAGNR